MMIKNNIHLYDEDKLRREIVDFTQQMMKSYRTDTNNQNSNKHPNAYKNIKNEVAEPLNKKSRKSCKRRKNTLNTNNIDEYIKEYIKRHPEVIAQYVKSYIGENLKIDFVKHNIKSDYYNSTDRYTVGLYDGNKLISESRLGLNI